MACRATLTRLVVAVAAAWLWMALPADAQRANGEETSAVCHECFWNIFPREFRNAAIAFYDGFAANDPLVAGEVDYILWRATGVPRCSARERYRHVAGDSRHQFRVLSAQALLGFTASECGENGDSDLLAAAESARGLALHGTARSLETAARRVAPVFANQQIDTALTVPAGATTFVLGETRLELIGGTRIGAQVERVARDWISYQMGWRRDGARLAPEQILDYHEGAFIRAMLGRIDASVTPLGGTVVARQDHRWFAPDENGVFRFEVLEDKVQYPTSHAAGDFGWLEDTHGISAIAGQALDRHMQVVVGCGDSEGKARAAFYLAKRGVHVILPGDRFQDLLIGYRAPGVLLGGAPIRSESGKVVVGDQPIRFSIREPIVVADTTKGRYFRRLSEYVPLNLVVVPVDDVDQIERLLSRAADVHASVVGLRVMTQFEDDKLRLWLRESAERRAVLFHSALYPYAQGLFRDFARQVTFGDLHPRFQ